jgi:hypothetical protein
MHNGERAGRGKGDILNLVDVPPSPFQMTMTPDCMTAMFGLFLVGKWVVLVMSKAIEARLHQGRFNSMLAIRSHV